jgi:hypothetical protein
MTDLRKRESVTPTPAKTAQDPKRNLAATTLALIERFGKTNWIG